MTDKKTEYLAPPTQLPTPTSSDRNQRWSRMCNMQHVSIQGRVASPLESMLGSRRGWGPTRGSCNRHPQHTSSGSRNIMEESEKYSLQIREKYVTGGKAKQRRRRKEKAGRHLICLLFHNCPQSTSWYIMSAQNKLGRWIYDPPTHWPTDWQRWVRLKRVRYNGAKVCFLSHLVAPFYHFLGYRKWHFGCPNQKNTFQYKQAPKTPKKTPQEPESDLEK